MKEKYDIALLVKIAQMYYIEGLKQEEIAKSLGMSRSLVSMFLTEARMLGIVEINIRDPLLNNEILASKFMRIFQLKQCAIIPTSVRDENALRKIIAQRTVEVFNRYIKGSETIGLAWGRVCHQFVSLYPNTLHYKGKSVVPLIGGSNQKASYFQINEMVRNLAEKMNGVPYFIHAPALASDREERDLYFQSTSMGKIQEKWKQMDMVITGIGSLPKSKDLDRAVYIGEYEIFRELESMRAVGDICARYFTLEGDFLRGTYYERTVAVPLEDLQKTKNILAIAAGMDKVQPILGALRAGIVSQLITDEQTAKAVLGLGGY